MRVKQYGDNAILLEVGDIIDRVTHARVMNYFQAFKELQIIGVEDLIPAYTSLTIVFDPIKTSYLKIAEVIGEIEVTNEYEPKSFIRLPVCYDLSMALDLNEISREKDLTEQEVVEIHLRTTYLVYMTGFLPGFLYLGEVDERIQFPRKHQPRKKVESGSVGIAGPQTGIYPLASPGGWNIIGRCPVKLFDLKRHNPFSIQVGELVQFYQIDKNEFHLIQGAKHYQIERQNASQ